MVGDSESSSTFPHIRTSKRTSSYVPSLAYGDCALVSIAWFVDRLLSNNEALQKYSYSRNETTDSRASYSCNVSYLNQVKWDGAPKMAMK